MSWDRDPLWSKARLYFERAFESRINDELFGLWFSFGVELLARAAVSSVSPTLLAEPDRDHKHLLHALNRGSVKTTGQSIGTVVVLSLCKSLFEKFSDEHFTSARALVNRRNEELHTGKAAFTEYPSNQWCPKIFRVCKVLCESMDESLENLFGEDEATRANELLAEIDKEIVQRVRKRISSHRTIFDEKTDLEKQNAKKRTKDEAEPLAYAGHHKVTCPACNCTATQQGHVVGKGNQIAEGSQIKVIEPMAPLSLACNACGLKLNSYAELTAAEMNAGYNRKSIYSPEVYYNLVDLDTYDLHDDVVEYLASHPEFHDESYGGPEMYDND